MKDKYNKSFRQLCISFKSTPPSFQCINKISPKDEILAVAFVRDINLTLNFIDIKMKLEIYFVIHQYKVYNHKRV